VEARTAHQMGVRLMQVGDLTHSAISPSTMNSALDDCVEPLFFLRVILKSTLTIPSHKETHHPDNLTD
jgi:hypothetical protein